MCNARRDEGIDEPSTVSSEFLGLTSSGVGDEESSVVRDEDLSDLEGGGGVLVLGNVGNDGLGDGLSESVHLRSVSSSGDTESDVHSGQGRGEGGGGGGERREEDEGFVEFGSKNRGSVEGDGDTVDLDQSLSFLITPNTERVSSHSVVVSSAKIGHNLPSHPQSSSLSHATAPASPPVYPCMIPLELEDPRTLASATAVAVFFFPNVWTL